MVGGEFGSLAAFLESKNDPTSVSELPPAAERAGGGHG